MTRRLKAATSAAAVGLLQRRVVARVDWDDDEGFLTPGMYTDWTAVILLLLTAAPLAVVVATAAFFIWRQKRLSQR